MTREELLAKRLGLNADSPTTRQVLDNLDMPVAEFVSRFRRGEVWREFPGQLLKEGLTVEQALLQGGSKVRKLLIDKRFAK